MTASELLRFMSEPSERLIGDVSKIEGDILILGAGGKVGPSLCVMAKRACEAAGADKRVYAVSLFDAETAALLRDYGVETINADLFDDAELFALPDCENIIFMVGRKFGTSDNQSLTWAINVLLPDRVCRRFPNAKFVVFSTGNVYGDVPISSGGSLESDEPNPDGEYGQTCLGRERVFEYYAGKNGTRSLLFRLNYAIGLNYGVLYDIASAVYDGKPVSLARSVYNCIWQGDCCEYALRALLHTSNPPNILNVTGAEIISTRRSAEQFGELFGKAPIFGGRESDMGVFSNTGKLQALMGAPNVLPDYMMRRQADWVSSGGFTINAPTHFEQSDGRY